MRRLLLLALAIAGGISAPVHAGLIGATVDVPAYYPDTASIFKDPGSRIVDATTVEYPLGSYSGYSDALAIDLTDTQLILSAANGLFFDDGVSFNGFVLELLSGATLVSASLAANSDFDPVITTKGNSVFLNYAGAAPLEGQQSIIDIVARSTNQVPEPGTVTLLALALAGLAATARRGATKR